ncbi:MAG: OsmC family protein [Gammaproteobacteria bacterium]|nr:OsmC family protein [Gammaproteobacteria bacterium]
MKVRVEKVRGMNFAAHAVREAGENPRVAISASPEIGGGDGARPMEMVLMGLGGCTAIDVGIILGKSRQVLTDLSIDISAERADAHPAVFTRIHLHYTLRGENLERRKVARALSLSLEKYCSVTRMLAATAEITHDFEIAE